MWTGHRSPTLAAGRFSIAQAISDRHHETIEKRNAVKTLMGFVLCASLVVCLPAGAASPAPQARLQETVRIALCQMSVADGDVRGNLAKIESQVKQAATLGARLCVFPELADVGFGPIVKAATGGEHARPIPGETTDALGRMAAAAKVWIAIALLEQVSGGVFDTIALVDWRKAFCCGSEQALKCEIADR